MNKLKGVREADYMNHDSLLIKITDGDYTYEGYSLPGAALDEPNWLIKRTYEKNNAIAISYSGDSYEHKKIWNNYSDYFAAVKPITEVRDYTFVQDVNRLSIGVAWKNTLAMTYNNITIYLDEAKTKIYKEVKDELIRESKYEFLALPIEKEYGSTKVEYHKEYWIDIQEIGVDLYTENTGKITSSPNVSAVITHKITI